VSAKTEMFLDVTDTNRASFVVDPELLDGSGIIVLHQDRATGQR
jgi:hypothetical protein